jgi:hypothetical protein
LCQDQSKLLDEAVHNVGPLTQAKIRQEGLCPSKGLRGKQLVSRSGKNPVLVSKQRWFSYAELLERMGTKILYHCLINRNHLRMLHILLGSLAELIKEGADLPEPVIRIQFAAVHKVGEPDHFLEGVSGDDLLHKAVARVLSYLPGHGPVGGGQVMRHKHDGLAGPDHLGGSRTSAPQVCSS